MKKIAVILSGCGFLDGAEVTESISLIIALSELNTQYEFFAPNADLKPVQHSQIPLTDAQNRNILEESSRITRGNINDLAKLKVSKFDGLAFPGGFGVAKSLCSWALDGAKCSVSSTVKEIITTFHKESKPILALCIAPALVAKALEKQANNLCLTIGSDLNTASEIEKTGAEHIDCEVEDFISDRENKVISSPAYMYEAKPHEVFNGIKKATLEFIEMC